jgi:hypothetical protein
VAFLGNDVEQDRSFDLFHHTEIFPHEADVVAVDRAEVVEAEILEKHAAVQAGFGGFLELGQEAFSRIAQQRHLA